jgi:hypothetical protein
MDSENVPASLLMAETRCPGEQRKISILFGGSSVPAVELTALSFGLTIAIRQPPVEGVSNQDKPPESHRSTVVFRVLDILNAANDGSRPPCYFGLFSTRAQTSQCLSFRALRSSCCIMSQQFPLRFNDFQSLPATPCDILAT